LRLVLAVDALSPALTGIGRYAWELAQRMPRVSGIDQVHYLRDERWVQDPATLLDTAPRFTIKQRMIRKLRRRIPQEWIAASLHRRCRGAVFHGPNYFVPPCADVAVATVHDLSIFKYPETHPVARLRHFEREFKVSMNRASHLITDSESTRREVIDFLGMREDRVSAVALGVSEAFLPRAVRASELPDGLLPGGYTLCVSSLEPRKRIGNLLAAYGSLPMALRRRWPLALAGGAGWLNEDLHRAIERGKDAGWLRHLGYVPEPNLPALYAGARLFAYPSVYEGFGLPALEAMACGIPVITSDRSCLPELVGSAGLQVNPDDVAALRDACERGLTDDAWRCMGATAGQNRSRTFTWDRCMVETVRVYERALYH
jgi:glycosyltransferase involved in cell wall biosynthesis